MKYDIGCNPDSPQYTDCVNWFNQSSSRTLKVSNTIQPLVCTISRPPGALSDVKTCTIQLPT
jgi:hypothetical protein